MKIKGSGSYVDAAGVRHEVKGLGSLPDDTNLQKLNASGTFEFGKISCNALKVNGKCEGGSVQSKDFSLSGKIEVDSITADEIVIESQAGSIGEIECKRLRIFNRVNEMGASFVAKLFVNTDSHIDNDSRIHIKNINADKVELENCEVDNIKCREANIGKNCAIEKLFVTGECKIANDSTIGETIRT